MESDDGNFSPIVGVADLLGRGLHKEWTGEWRGRGTREREKFGINPQRYIRFATLASIQAGAIKTNDCAI